MIRPAGLLPEQVPPHDPFALALRRIEFESGRVMQAQILFLKSSDLLPLREQVTSVVESRHRQLRKLWREMLAGIGVEPCNGTGITSCNCRRAIPLIQINSPPPGVQLQWFVSSVNFGAFHESGFCRASRRPDPQWRNCHGRWLHGGWYAGTPAAGIGSAEKIRTLHHLQ